MRDQSSQDPEQRGGDVRKGAEGSRGYGRAIDCAASRPDPRMLAAGHRHGRGAAGDTGETYFLRG